MDSPASWRTLAIDLQAESPFRVGDSTIHPLAREAEFPGGSERLQPQSLKVLVALARRRGEVVTRAELVESCWQGRVIGEDVINRSILILRQFAERTGGFTIETVPKVGYRLIETRGEAPARKKRLIIIMTLAVTLAAALTGLGLWRARPGPTAQTISVALLPFATDSADPAAAKLGFDAHDSLAHTLTQSRFSVKLLGAAPQQSQPVADFIISGAVDSDREKMTVTVRMEEAAHHVTIYTHRFEASRSELSVLPDQMGAQVAGSLGWKPPLLMLERNHPSDPAVLRELFAEPEIENLGPQKWYDAARGIAAKAPNSAIAQISLAYGSAYALPNLPRSERPEAVASGRRATERALALAPGFGEAYSPWCLLHSSVRMVECEDRLRAAKRADPDAPFVDLFLSQDLNDVGRVNEAMELAKRTLAYDQYVPGKITVMLRMLEATGQTKEAEKLYQKGTRWWPNDESFVWNRLEGQLARGDFVALENFAHSVGADLVPVNDRPLRLLAAIRKRDVAAVKAACLGIAGVESYCMLGLASLGDFDGAFTYADKLYPRMVGLTPLEEEKLWLDNPGGTPRSLLASPAAASLRKDPRFLIIAERVGLLQYWRSGRLPDFCTTRHEPVCAMIKLGR